MRFLENTYFARQLKFYALDEHYAAGILGDIFRDRSEPLGKKLYKIRASGKGQGKSGGFRNIFFWQKGKLIIFCCLFAKNVKADITDREFKALKILAEEYDQLSEDEINLAVEKGSLKEVLYDQGRR